MRYQRVALGETGAAHGGGRVDPHVVVQAPCGG